MGTPTHTEKRLYSIPEAVAALGISRSGCYKLLDSGELDSVKIGRRRLIPAAALDDLVARLSAAA